MSTEERRKNEGHLPALSGSRGRSAMQGATRSLPEKKPLAVGIATETQRRKFKRTKAV
jgi:hypothetical protein